MKELLMGSDMKPAIEKGMTLIRLSTAIFGTRLTLDSYCWNENAKI